MAENGTSHCNIQVVSKCEESNDSIRGKVWKHEDNNDNSDSNDSVKHNAVDDEVEANVSLKSDTYTTPSSSKSKGNEVSEPVPCSSSNDPSAEDSAPAHTFWLASPNIKTENVDNDSKNIQSKEDEGSEEERLEEESDFDMDDESNGGAYHLAEVSYGDENEDSQKAGDTGVDPVLDFKNSTSPRLETIDDIPSLASPEKLASDFIIKRKNVKVVNISGRVNYKNFECLICGYQAPQRSSLLDHIHKHTGERMHHCLHCDKKFRYKSYLAQHITIYHTDFEAQFSCKLCGQRFAKESAYQRHERTHSGERPFPCDFCDYQARHRGALKDHLRIHTGEKPYECTECGYKCAYSTLLKRHFTKYHEQKTFECPSCSYVTKQMRNLTDHLKTHNGDKYYHCDKCSYKSTRKDSLKSHINNVHSNECITCTICKAKFKYTKTLDKHTYEHHPDKFPFQCDLCHLRFKRPRGLALHNRKRHLEEKI